MVSTVTFSQVPAIHLTARRIFIFFAISDAIVHALIDLSHYIPEKQFPEVNFEVLMMPKSNG